MAQAQTKEELLAEWWAGWWKLDFSWAGLAKKDWQGWSVITAPDGAHYAVETDTGLLFGAEEGAEPLATAPDPEKRQASLQDYWRADPATGRMRTDAEMGDELVMVDGQPVFHRVHLPLEWRDKTPTGKADWPDDALDALTAPRLAAARETAFEGEWYDRKLVGADRRAQFAGGVWLRESTHPEGADTPLSVQYEGAHFARYAGFSGASFAGEAAFESACFALYTTFERTSFFGNAIFKNTIFLGFSELQSFICATFEHTAFFGITSFENASFNGDARFDGANFASHTIFRRANFAQISSFEDTNIAGTARFEGVNFAQHTVFRRTNFAGDVGYESSIFFGNVEFESAGFGCGVRFSNVTFVGQANFGNARFCDEANFGGANFSKSVAFDNARFFQSAYFWDVNFNQDASFESVTFLGSAIFSSARFVGSVSWTVAQFAGEADFSSVHLASHTRFDHSIFMRNATFIRARIFGYADFTNTKFSMDSDGKPTKGRANFAEALFEQLVVFSGAAFHNTVSFQQSWFKRLARFNGVKLAPESQGEPWRGMFTGALFEASLDWQGADMRGVSVFANARFDRGVLLSRDSEKQDRANHDAALKLAEAAPAITDRKGKETVPAAENRRRALAALEGGAVKLKLAMEAEADHARAQRFHRLELIAARKQTDKWSVKAVSHAFGLFAGYGASIGRPLFWLAALIGLFAAGFVGLDRLDAETRAARACALEARPPEAPACLPIPDAGASWVQALDFSLSNTFKPLSAVASGNEFKETNPLAFRLLYRREGRGAAETFVVDAMGLGVRLIGIFQSILAIVLVFLSGLAIKRRFQISA
jgi:hypothetical protein